MTTIDKLSPEDLKTMFEKGDFSPYSDEKIFSDTKYNYESLKSAPFFGQETLGIYLKIYEFLGNKGYSPALYELGLIYYNGEWWLQKDYLRSSNYHFRAADLGNADALFELYIYYSKGIGVMANSKTALEYCQKAAALNHPRACYNLGAFYASGNGVPKNINTAIEWYEKASKAGNGQASATLAVMYKMGNGTEADAVKADFYIKRAASQYFDIDGFLAKFGLKR